MKRTKVTHDIDGLTPFSVFNVAVSEVLKGDVAVGDDRSHEADRRRRRSRRA